MSELLPPEMSPPVIEAPEASRQFVVSAVARCDLDQLSQDQRTRVRREIHAEHAYDELAEEYRP